MSEAIIKSAHDPTGGPVREETGAIVEDPEPRWPAIIAVLCAGGLNFALPSTLSAGPRWLLFAIVGILLIPTIALHRAGHHRLNTAIGHILAGVMTLFMVWSIIRLIQTLVYNKSGHHLEALDLLHSALFLWVTNVLVFGLWYWRLDAGGPNARDLRVGHPCGSFLFPQMTLQEDYDADYRGKPWSPQFADYLFGLQHQYGFVANGYRRPVALGQLLMMMQSMISLTIIVLLAARAVNILQ